MSDRGETEWKIVVGAGASETERYAASELRRYLAEIGGAELPVVAESAAEIGGTDLPDVADSAGEVGGAELPIVADSAAEIGGTELSVDADSVEENGGTNLPVVAGSAAKEIRIGLGCRRDAQTAAEASGWGAEEFVIRAGEDGLLIAGGSPRGTLYGVYAFLERYLGCRWFTPKVSRIPRRSRITVGAIDERHAPAMEYRQPYFFEALDADWAARNKCNGNFYAFEPKHGGGVSYTGTFVHSFNDLVPVETYYDEHPEYFSEIGGVRQRKDTQLCLSNPDVLDIALRRLREWLDAAPEANIVSVSQNDWQNPCQCADCRAVDEEEGNYSGSLIRFVNRVAEALEPDYPHVAVDTLAYQYTRKAPKLARPRPNVIVRLCSIECCFSHPLEECGEKMLLKNNAGTGATFVQDLEAWGRICNRLYVWDYVTNFSNYVLPFPNLGVLGPNVRLFARNNVKGLFEQGSCPPGGGGEFAELRAYVLAKLLWNPEADEERLMDEFLIGVYGLGGTHLRRYIDMLRRDVKERRLHASIYDLPANEYITPELLRFADEMFDAAESLAADDGEAERLRRARMPIRYAKLSLLPTDAPGRDALLDAFHADALQAGMTQLTEFIPMQKTMDYLRKGVMFTHFARYDHGWHPYDETWPTPASAHVPASD